MSGDRAEEAYGKHFAQYYDVLTGHKDYSAEVAALDARIRTLDGPAVRRILDVGCGTGRHARALQERGYDLTAIDMSPDMIAMANLAPGNVRFLRLPLAELDEAPFHLVLSLFNVVNCLETFSQLEDFFREVHRRLRPGGGFLFECWNAVAVIAAPPSVVERIFSEAGKKLIRKVTPTPDFFRQRLRLEYNVEIAPADDTRPNPETSHFKSVHHLMLFTPEEIRHLLLKVGFSDIEFLTALPDLSPATNHDRMLAVSCRRL